MNQLSRLVRVEAIRVTLYQEWIDACAALRKIIEGNRHSNGLVFDHVKASAPYIEAKNSERRAFYELRKFNQTYKPNH